MAKRGLILVAAGLATTDPASLAHAEARFAGGTLSGSLTLASMYVSRGLSNSDHHPTAQGILDYAHDSGLYLGTFLSNVDFDDNDNATFEWDIYGGYSWTWRDVTFRGGVLAYIYPGVGRGLSDDFNTIEYEGSVTYAIAGATVSAGLSYSPNYVFNSGDSFYYSVNGSIPIFRGRVIEELAIEAHAGHQEVQRNAVFGAPDYTDWSIGVAGTYRSIKAGLYYVDTNLDRDQCFAGKQWCAARALAVVSYTF